MDATRDRVSVGDVNNLLGQELSDMFRQEGAVLSGVASADLEVEKKRFFDWLETGKMAGMTWLTRSPERRVDPRLVLEGCRSVLVGAWPTGKHQGEPPPGHGRIAAYVGAEDYHVTIGGSLQRIAGKLKEKLPAEAFKPYVDTGPVLERDWARMAGLGWIGKNTMLIHPQEGSFLLLGVILSTAHLPWSKVFTGKHCGNCTKCISACPVDALDETNGLDARKCLSYWNIEHKGEFEAATPSAGLWASQLYGCDICQDACPFNRNTPPAPGPKDLPLELAANGLAAFPKYLRRGKKALARNAKWLLEKCEAPPA